MAPVNNAKTRLTCQAKYGPAYCNGVNIRNEVNLTQKGRVTEISFVNFQFLFLNY